MSVTNNVGHLSTVTDTIYSQDSIENDVRNLSHPWGINPVIYLEQVRQKSRINKLRTIQESLTNITQFSSLSNKEPQDENIHEIINILENLKTIRSTLLTLNEFDIESATQYGKQLMMITTDILFRVINQIGQTNVRTPTLESILAYIRSLIHMRSAHMRQTIPGSLLITWYELSHLMSSMLNEPELRITNKKAIQLLDIAHKTAAWAYKYLSTEQLDDDPIDFIDRSSIPDTYE